MKNAGGFLARVWRRNAPATIIGVVILTLLTAVAYDFALRPGIGKLGRVVLQLITLGSQTVQDNAYAAAALDPAPKTALLLLMIAILITTIVAVIPATIRLAKKQVSKDMETMRQRAGSDEAAYSAFLQESIRKDERVLNWLLGAFSILLILLWGSFLVHSQSIMVWRVFHSDLARVAPFLTESQRLMYESRYAGMRTRNDYIEIHKEFRRIAESQRVTLRSEETW